MVGHCEIPRSSAIGDGWFELAAVVFVDAATPTFVATSVAISSISPAFTSPSIGAPSADDSEPMDAHPVGSPRPVVSPFPPPPFGWVGSACRLFLHVS